MTNRLRTALLAASFAVAVGPAVAGGLPDYGTKNFVSGGDVPAFFDNPNLSVAPGDPDQSPISRRYSAADDYPETRSAEPPARRDTRSATRSVAHGAGHRSGMRASAQAGSRTHPVETRSTRPSRTAASRRQLARGHDAVASRHTAPRSARTATARTRPKSGAHRPVRHAANGSRGRSG